MSEYVALIPAAGVGARARVATRDPPAGRRPRAQHTAHGAWAP